MIVTRIEHLLKESIGLDAASIGSSAVLRAVEARIRSCRISDVEAYWELLSTSPAELQALVEAVIVPETWFFRDREAFAAAVRMVTTEWLPRRAEGTPLRLLSLPCSTGEEPYTLAMSLLDAGFRPGDFRIDGIDISRHSLEQAGKAIYGRNSFRGSDLGYRERYFTPAGTGWQLADKVCRTVRFAQGNLFELAAPDAAYDVIFCRNLLIYFDAADQRRAVGVLRRMLAPDGMIFVGHSEASLMMGEGFASAKMPLAFAFRGQEVRKSPPAVVGPVARKKISADPSRVPSYRKTRPAAPPKPAPSALAAHPPASIDEIHALADRGDIAGALAKGEAYLRKNTPTPAALHLLGVISEAGGDAARAIAYYKKALYLDPGHRDAIAHVALLLDRAGDINGARRMRERASRLGEVEAC